MKASFIYDDQDKDSHRFVTPVPGGHGDPFADCRNNSHLRFTTEATMVQKCCGGDLWQNRDGQCSVNHSAQRSGLQKSLKKISP
jgi:hypothetical protein